MTDLLDVAFVELVAMNNYPNDREYVDRDDEGRLVRRVLPGESLADTARRIESVISKPPPPPPPVVPLELRDPEAPEGWYDEPDTSGAWSAFAARQGIVTEPV